MKKTPIYVALAIEIFIIIYTIWTEIQLYYIRMTLEDQIMKTQNFIQSYVLLGIMVLCLILILLLYFVFKLEDLHDLNTLPQTVRKTKTKKIVKKQPPSKLPIKKVIKKQKNDEEPNTFEKEWKKMEREANKK